MPGSSEQSLEEIKYIDANATHVSSINPKQRSNLHRNIFSSFSSQSLSNLQSSQLLNQNFKLNTLNQKLKLDETVETDENNETSINNNNGSPNTIKSPNNLNSNDCLTLLDWVKSTDPQNKLQSVIQETKEILENFDSKLNWTELEQNINDLFIQLEKNQHLKDIDGLAKRLDDLKDFIQQATKFLTNQNEISEVKK
jgi:hypothetical protein